MGWFEDLALLSRRDRWRLGILAAVLVVLLIAATTYFFHPGAPRKIVMASGDANGVYHRYAQRYIQHLGREGVKVQERMTQGAVENLQLLLDPKSGVDIAFIQGGLADPPRTDGLVMIASIYYEPLWIFYRDPGTLTRLKELHGKRIAVGTVGSGTRALALRLLEANGVVDHNGIGRDVTDIVSIGGPAAVQALRSGEIEALLLVGGADAPAIQQALRDPVIKLMNLDQAEAYRRRFPFISKLKLPAGTIDLSINVPDHDIEMVGTKAMLVTREGFHPALTNLILNAARDINGEQGYFEAAGEFPDIAKVDLTVSSDADEHKRFGPSLLYRYLPFWLAAILERAIIVLVPLAVIAVPAMNLLPQVVRWRIRSRIFKRYAELNTLQYEVATSKGVLPIDEWMRKLDRIEQSAEEVQTPASFASEAYTLREHIALVRRAILAKAEGARTSAI